MSATRSSNGLAWLLCECILTLINHSNGMIYERLNLTMLSLDTAYAMLDNDKDRKTLDSERVKAQELRKNYNPKLDGDIYGNEARTVFQLALDDIMRALLIVIYTNDLVNPSMLSEIKAKAWS